MAARGPAFHHFEFLILYSRFDEVAPGRLRLFALAGGIAAELPYEKRPVGAAWNAEPTRLALETRGAATAVAASTGVWLPVASGMADATHIEWGTGAPGELVLAGELAPDAVAVLVFVDDRFATSAALDLRGRFRAALPRWLAGGNAALRALGVGRDGSLSELAPPGERDSAGRR